MMLTDRQKTLLIFAAHFSPTLILILAGLLISWEGVQGLTMSYGRPAWEDVKNLLMGFKLFVVMPSLAVVVAYVFCYRVKRRIHRGLVIYAAWLTICLLSSFLGAISCEGTSTAVVAGVVHWWRLFRELLSVTLYFLAWHHLFIIPWVLLFVYGLKRFPWLFPRASVEARVLTEHPLEAYDATSRRLNLSRKKKEKRLL